MNNIKIDELKKIYQSQQLPSEIVEGMWQNLSLRLPERKRYEYHHLMRYSFLSLFITFLVLGGVVGLAQAAKPSTPFYAVRVLTDRIVAKATKSYGVNIQKRADEVFDAAKSKSADELEQSSKAYSETLEDVNPEEKKTDNSKKELEEALENTKKKLEQITPADKKSEEIIERSINATEKTKAEVKDAHSENAEENKSNGENGQQSSRENQNNNSNSEEEHGKNENRGKE